MNSRERKKHKCATCEYGTNNRSHLIRHERVHTGEKPFKCDQCSYTCTQRANLTSHKRSHTGEKPYKCHLCNYASAKSSHLRDHERKHKGEKPYKCHQCSYTCTQRAHLTVHKRTHTGEKPFKCDQCNYASASSSHLKTHKRKHTGEKPFKCSTCDFSCTRRISLIRHERSSHKNEHCPGCKATFTTKRALKSHAPTCRTTLNPTAPPNRNCECPSNYSNAPVPFLTKVKPCSVQIRRLSQERIHSLFQTHLPSNNGVMDIKREPCPDTTGTEHPPNINEGTLFEKPCFKIDLPSIKEEPSDSVDEVPLSSNVTRDYVECRDADRSNIKIEQE